MPISGKQLSLSMRIQRLRQQRRTKQLKPPYMCPYCSEKSFIVEKRGQFIVAFCQKCKLGEVMPQHDTLEYIDYYCIVIDNTLDKTIPIFRYRSMKRKRYFTYLTYVTLGRLHIDELL